MATEEELMAFDHASSLSFAVWLSFTDTYANHMSPKYTPVGVHPSQRKLTDREL